MPWEHNLLQVWIKLSLKYDFLWEKHGISSSTAYRLMCKQVLHSWVHLFMPQCYYWKFILFLYFLSGNLNRFDIWDTCFLFQSYTLIEQVVVGYFCFCFCFLCFLFFVFCFPLLFIFIYLFITFNGKPGKIPIVHRYQI